MSNISINVEKIKGLLKDDEYKIVEFNPSATYLIVVDVDKDQFSHLAQQLIKLFAADNIRVSVVPKFAVSEIYELKN